VTVYQPEAFRVTEEHAKSLVREHPFATLMAVGGAELEVSHNPLLLAEGGAHGRLLGHVARRNPIWRAYAGGAKALALFHGPHAYVTPRWYARHDVPTWNYAVVHVEGTVRVLEAPKDIVRILALMTERFEGDGPEAWRFGLPDDLQDGAALAAAIVGLEVTIERVTAKFKLSQNRVDADQEGVMRGLAERDDEQSAGVLALMRAARSSARTPS
jgi:transcriptional regulator